MMTQSTLSVCNQSQADSPTIKYDKLHFGESIATNAYRVCRVFDRIPEALRYHNTCCVVRRFFGLPMGNGLIDELVYIFGCHSEETVETLCMSIRDVLCVKRRAAPVFAYNFSGPIHLRKNHQHTIGRSDFEYGEKFPSLILASTGVIPPYSIICYPAEIGQPAFSVHPHVGQYATVKTYGNPLTKSSFQTVTPLDPADRGGMIEIAINEHNAYEAQKRRDIEFAKAMNEMAILPDPEFQRLVQSGDVEENPGPTDYERFLATSAHLDTSADTLANQLFRRLSEQARCVACSCNSCVKPFKWKWAVWQAMVGKDLNQQKCIWTFFRYACENRDIADKWNKTPPTADDVCRLWVQAILQGYYPRSNFVVSSSVTDCLLLQDIDRNSNINGVRNQVGIFGAVTGIDVDTLNNATARTQGILDGVELVLDRMVRATDAEHLFNDGNICTAISLIMQVIAYIQQPSNLLIGSIGMSCASLFTKDFSVVKLAIQQIVDAFAPPAQENLGIANQFGETVGIAPIVAAVGLLLAHSVPDVSVTKKIVSSLTLAAPAVKLMESGGNLMSKILDFLPCCIQAWIYHYFPSLATVEFMTRDTVIEFMKRSNRYDEAGYLRSGMTSAEDKRQLLIDLALCQELYDEALEIYKEKPIPAAFVRAVTIVNKVAGVVKSGFSRNPDSQMCAFWLYVTGPSNIGKSVITRDLAFIMHGLDVMKQIPAHPGEDESTYYERAAKLARSRGAYDRRPGQKFWDSYLGVSGGHYTVVIDDFAQCDPKITGNAEGAEIISLLSATNAQIGMASLEEKGAIMDSPLLITSSNMRTPELPEINVREAILRRRNCVVEMSIDESKGKWMATSANSEGHWVFNPDYVGGKYDQYLFQLYDPMTDVKIGDKMHFDAFVKKFCQMYANHHKNQRRTTLIPNQLLHLAVATADSMAEEMPENFRTTDAKILQFVADREEPFYDSLPTPLGGSISQTVARDLQVAAHNAALLGVSSQALRHGREMVATIRQLDIFATIKMILSMSKDAIVEKFGEWALTLQDLASRVDRRFLLIAGMCTGVGAFLLKQAWDHYHPSQKDILGQFMEGEVYTREKIFGALSNRIRDMAGPECDELLVKVRQKNEAMYQYLYHTIGMLDSDDWNIDDCLQDMGFTRMAASNYLNLDKPKRVKSVGRVAKRNGAKWDREVLINQAFLELDVAMNGQTSAYKTARKQAEKDIEEGRTPEFIEKMQECKPLAKRFGKAIDPLLQQMYCNRTIFLNKIFCIDRQFYFYLVTYLNNAMDWDEFDQTEHLKRLRWNDLGYPAELEQYLPAPVEIQELGVVSQARGMNATNFAEQVAIYMETMYRNIVHLGIGDTPELFGLYGVGVAGDVLVTVHHIFNHVVPGQELTIQTQGRNYVIVYDPTCMWKVEGKDVAFYRLPPGKVPLFKDFRNRFQTEEDLWLYEQREAMMLSYNTRTNTPMFCSVGSAVRSTEVDYIKGHEISPEGEVTYNLNSVAYICKVKAIGGACGLPMLSMKKSDERRVMGIHIGARGTTSVSVAVTREDIDAAFEHLVGATTASSIGSELLYADISKEPTTETPLGYSVIGKSPVKGFTPTKSVFSQSEIYGKLAMPMKQPAILTADDPRCPPGWNPMLEGMAKYDHESPNVDLHLVERVRKHMSDRVIAQFDKNHCRKWTMQEAIMGIEGDPVAKKMCFSSSAGWPWRQFGGKQRGKYAFIDMFDADGQITHDAECMVTAQLRDEPAKMIRAEDACLQLGGTLLLPFTDQMKDELRLNEKIEAGKTRHFMAGSLDSLVLSRMYFGGFMTAMFRSHNESYFAPGMDAESDEWDAMTRYLLRPGNMAFAADVSSMDGNEVNQYMVMACDIVNDWYGAHHIGTKEQLDKDNRARRAIIESVIHAVSVCGDSVHQKHTGMPSGTFLTTFVNSLVILAYIKTIWIQLAPTKLKSLRYFDQYCAIKVYGDDFVLTISPVVSEWFNGLSITAAAKRYLGQTFTSANKHTDIVPLIHISECEFLKRSFVYHKEWDMWIGRYRWDEMVSMADYVRNGNPPVDQLMLNIEEMMEQAVTYGKEPFETLRNKVILALREEAIPHPVITYEEAYYDFYTRHHPDENRNVIKASLDYAPGVPSKDGLASA